MQPLGDSLSEFDERMKLVRPGHVIGFLLDSVMGDLKRSGLIQRSECVMPMNRLMRDRATIFYVGPNRVHDAQSYRDAVKSFNHSISQRPEITFEVEPPCLILMEHQSSIMGDVTYHRFPRQAPAIWFTVMHEALEEKLQHAELSRGRWERIHSAVVEHLPSIAMDSMKASVAMLLSRLL